MLMEILLFLISCFVSLSILQTLILTHNYIHVLYIRKSIIPISLFPYIHTDSKSNSKKDKAANANASNVNRPHDAQQDRDGSPRGGGNAGAMQVSPSLIFRLKGLYLYSVGIFMSC